MAKSSEAWRSLVSEVAKTKALSGKWLNRKPTLEEFDLDDYNLNVLFKERNRFEDNKIRRSKELQDSKPILKRGQFTWDGYVALAFMMGMVAYQFLYIGEQPSWAVFGFLALGAMFFFFLYYFRLRRNQIRTKKEIERINEEIKKNDAAEYEYEDAYERLGDYAEAVHDYEAWERRRTRSSWKKYTEKQFVNEITSMLKTYGYSADIAERKNIDIIYDSDEEGRDAIFCEFWDRITLPLAEGFKKAMSRVGIYSGGIIISDTPVDKDAREFCESNGIEIWNIDDVLKWEKEIEKYVSEE